jgi:hypothetical protein
MRGRCFYSIEELSSITGVPIPDLQQDIDSGKLKTVKLKDKLKVTLYELKTYMSPERFDDFFKNKYLSEERLFELAGIEQSYWEHTLLVQSPDWDYVLIFTKEPEQTGEMMKVALNPTRIIDRDTMSSDTFISLLQSNQFTSISRYEEYQTVKEA